MYNIYNMFNFFGAGLISHTLLYNDINCNYIDSKLIYPINDPKFNDLSSIYLNLAPLALIGSIGFYLTQKKLESSSVISFLIAAIVFLYSRTKKKNQTRILKKDPKTGTIKTENASGNFDYLVSVEKDGKKEEHFCSENDIK